MNYTLLSHKADTINDATLDSTDFEFAAVNDELYKNFNFITETYSSSYKGPVDREVSFVSEGWNFVILFIVMIMVVLNKFIAPRRFFSIITMPFNGGEKMMRESGSYINVISFLTLMSFVLLISMLIQKVYVLFGGNYILHENLRFFSDVAIAVATAFILNYLLVLFYSWLFDAENLIVFHVGLYLSAMSTCNFLLIPSVLIILFYPYKFFLVLSFILVFILFTIRLIKLLIEVRMFAKLNFVNIFLYLCTIEVLPVLIISKMIFMIL